MRDFFPQGEKGDIWKYHIGFTKGQAISLPSIFRPKVSSIESICREVFTEELSINYFRKKAPS